MVKGFASGDLNMLGLILSFFFLRLLEGNPRTGPDCLLDSLADCVQKAWFADF